MLSSRWVNGFITLIFSLVEMVIAMRIVLKFFGANPNAPFANWVYETSKPLLYPFQGIFPSPALTGGYVIEVSALFGLAVYVVVAYFFQELVSFVEFRAESKRR